MPDSQVNLLVPLVLVLAVVLVTLVASVRSLVVIAQAITGRRSLTSIDGLSLAATVVVLSIWVYVGIVFYAIAG